MTEVVRCKMKMYRLWLVRQPRDANKKDRRRRVI